MDKELNSTQEAFDAEFEKWLGEQLKESMVEPPANFTGSVMATIEKKPLNGNIDTLWVTILIIISLIMTAFIGVIYLIPSEFFQQVNFSSLININGSIKSVVQYGSLLLLGVTIFYGVDNFLEQRFRNKNLAPL